MEEHKQRMEAETDADRGSKWSQVANSKGKDAKARKAIEFIEGSVANIDDRLGVPLRYDVFLSFRGVDTRLGFIDHLHHALKDADLETFLDDEEIETGQDLKPELENAIKSSRASIIVLSKNYASSTWCLDELALILEQHMRSSEHFVIPVFYHVNPPDVRKQQSSFGDAMEKHKQRMEAEADVEKRNKFAQKMELWKKALTQIANLKAKDVNGRKETEFIKEIVTDIYRRLGVPSRSPLPLLIGMDYAIESVTSWLKDGSSHTVDILTILGMGGIGKTSLAKYVYGLHCHEFHTSCFIEDISSRCAVKFNGLLDLQKQLCGGISEINSIQVHDDSIYTSKIENALARKKALLVLDDIDSLEQLDALLGNKGFHPGSKIIITTRDTSLIERSELYKTSIDPRHKNHLLQGLSRNASLELLSRHAFTCNNPKEGYEGVSRKLVKCCEGHPLALEVLGKSLYNRDVAFWEDCKDMLEREPHYRIRKALQMSFDSLPLKNDRELFKHIACFFVGTDRDYTETILNACDINTRSGMTNLIDRCLLSIGWNNTLMMHQLIQEMGRDVVRQEHVKPWKRSRLWCHEESFEVLKRKKGTKNIVGLALDLRILERKKSRRSFDLTNAFSKMDNLMLLQLNCLQFNWSNENFPEQLRWLCMHGFPLKSILLDLPMESLVVLDMSYSKIESFDMSFYSNPQEPQKRRKLTGSSSKEKRLLGSLKILDLSFSERLRSLGGFLELPALERLILRRCISLVEVCESIDHCVELLLIDLGYCNKLEKLPTALGKLKKVKTLLLDGCGLNIGTKSQTSSSAIVEAIPNVLKIFAISLPTSLVSLSLQNTKLTNETFPMEFGSLPKLKKLNLIGNPIVSLPNCVRSLPRLETLLLNHCRSLTSIEHPPRTLRNLSVYHYNGQHDNMYKLQSIVFDRDMSPLVLIADKMSLAHSSLEFEGVIKTQPMALVEEKVLCSLGWSDLAFIKKRSLGTYDIHRGAVGSQIQMHYEFGIFSIIYEGEEMPIWISERRKGGSISFTIPSSPFKLTGLNFCCVEEKTDPYAQFDLPEIRISNMTKNRTWIYKHYIGPTVEIVGKCIIMLSHWMFGTNEMEVGDHVTITLTGVDDEQLTKDCQTLMVVHDEQLTKECGVAFVYDEEEEDVLRYYKSWNHILGGDLSPFRSSTTPGEYRLDNTRFVDVMAL